MSKGGLPCTKDLDDNGACFIVHDHNGQALAYVYYEDEPHVPRRLGFLA
jgi:hypothetical protein